MRMQYDAKREYMKQEGDAYFRRNFNQEEIVKASIGTKLFHEFISKQMCVGDCANKKLLEIGCCYGYNLAYLNNECGFESYGIEPSGEAIAYGENLFGDKIEFSQGTVDNLPYEDDFFGVVIVGFCLYQVDRKLLARALSEIDRVLISGGYLVISDFDTPVPCKRENKHNYLTPTYKDNYGDMFRHLPYRYTLIEKKTYSSDGDFIFLDDIQERVSTQIFYKEKDFYTYQI